MAGFKRNITVSIGFITANVALTSAKMADKESELTQLCDGTNSECGTAHDLAKPDWDPVCSITGKTVKRGSLVKGKEIAPGQFVPFTADEIAGLAAADAAYKGALTLTPHDAVEVEGKTMPSGTVYLLSPGVKDRFFGLLRDAINDCPDLAFLGRYTVTSRASTYRVRPLGDLLVAEQMIDPEMMAEHPPVDLPATDEAMLAAATQVIRTFVSPYDPASYVNQYREALAKAVEAREASPMASIAQVAAGTPVADPMAALMAQMSSHLTGTKSEPAPVEAKKAPAKRTRKAS